jgi:glycolate oxidase
MVPSASPVPLSQPLAAAALDELRERLGEDGLRTDEAARQRYGHDETEDWSFPPQAVALPATPEQVCAVMAWATRHRVPVTPRGAGTGLSGGALAVHGGLCLSVERLNRIRWIDRRDLSCEAESGVITGELQRQVEELGLYYPPDPASRASCMLAGNLAEDSAGPHSCKYGTTRRFVLSLEAVLPSGELIRTGARTRKDATGYNLTQLLVGSEGTLAVITAATLRLIAKPAARLVLVIPFGELEAAAAAVEQIFLAGLDPAACELMEEGAIAAVGEVMELPRGLSGQQAMLLVELDGDDPEALLERAAALDELTASLGGGEPLVAQDAAEQRRLWAVREKIGEAVKQRSMYKESDTVVPRKALAEVVRAARQAASDHGLVAVCYGHAGDGNLHVNLLRGDLPAERWEVQRDAAERQLFAAVIELGGTLSGEHGIGWSQRHLLPMAIDPPTLAVMRQVKRSFDPLGILNPGKIFPDLDGASGVSG